MLRLVRRIDRGIDPMPLVREQFLDGHSLMRLGRSLLGKMDAAAPCATQVPQRSPVSVVLRPQAYTKRVKCSTRGRSISEKAQERLQSSLAALDALLLPTAEAKHADEKLEPSDSGLSTQKAAAEVTRDSDASERSSGVPSTSEPELSLSNWRTLDKKVLLGLALAKGQSWLKDQIKPTSIIEEDDYLPRVKPRFAYFILAANIVVYAVGLSRLFTEGPEGPTNYFLSLAEVNEAIEAGEYYRIVTANFLHDSFVHLGVSSYALLTIAPEAEAVLGSFAFLTTYLLGGIAGTTVCFLLTDTLMVGASSGIFGLIGAMGAFLYKNHKAPKSSDGLAFAAALLAFNLFLGNDHKSTVDNLGHLGGLVCGIYLGVLLSPAVIEDPTDSSSDSANPASSEAGIMKGTTPGATMPQLQGAGMEGEKDNGQGRNVQIVQPNRIQSLVVLTCVSMTMASSVAATVLHRTGGLPLPKWW